MNLPSVLKKHLGIPSADKLHLPLEEWLAYFFTFALDKKKNFYWAWDRFLIVVRREKDRVVLVLEVLLPKAPFLLQKHVDITHLSRDALVASLLYLYRHYGSSPRLRRNREHSVHYLSFLSFAQMLANHDIKKLPEPPRHGKINRLLVAYLMTKLDMHGVRPLCQEKQDRRRYSLSQLLTQQRVR